MFERAQAKLREARFEWELFRERFPDKAAMFVAWKLPRRVAYWAYIRLMAHATTGPYGTTHPDDVTYSMAMDRWEKGPHPVPDDPLDDDGYWNDSAFEPIAVPNEH